jgi:hypothetical protein
MIDRDCPYGCGEHIEVPCFSANPPPDVQALGMGLRGEIYLRCPGCGGALDVETGDPWEPPVRTSA